MIECPFPYNYSEEIGSDPVSLDMRVHLPADSCLKGLLCIESVLQEGLLVVYHQSTRSNSVVFQGIGRLMSVTKDKILISVHAQ